MRSAGCWQNREKREILQAFMKNAKKERGREDIPASHSRSQRVTDGTPKTRVRGISTVLTGGTLMAHVQYLAGCDLKPDGRNLSIDRRCIKMKTWSLRCLLGALAGMCCAVLPVTAATMVYRDNFETSVYGTSWLGYRGTASVNATPASNADDFRGSIAAASATGPAGGEGGGQLIFVSRRCGWIILQSSECLSRAVRCYS